MGTGPEYCLYLKHNTLKKQCAKLHIAEDWLNTAIEAIAEAPHPYYTPSTHDIVVFQSLPKVKGIQYYRYKDAKDKSARLLFSICEKKDTQNLPVRFCVHLLAPYPRKAMAEFIKNIRKAASIEVCCPEE
jgi:hypothetical protein